MDVHLLDEHGKVRHCQRITGFGGRAKATQGRSLFPGGHRTVRKSICAQGMRGIDTSIQLKSFFSALLMPRCFVSSCQRNPCIQCTLIEGVLKSRYGRFTLFSFFRERLAE
ncbi:hypothetical protein D3C81_1990550 [compost metagenome]